MKSAYSPDRPPGLPGPMSIPPPEGAGFGRGLAYDEGEGASWYPGEGLGCGLDRRIGCGVGPTVATSVPPPEDVDSASWTDSLRCGLVVRNVVFRHPVRLARDTHWASWTSPGGGHRGALLRSS